MRARIFLTAGLLSICACGQGSGPSGSPAPIANAASVHPSNGVIDLTVAASREPQTDPEVFDESVIFENWPTIVLLGRKQT